MSPCSNRYSAKTTVGLRPLVAAQEDPRERLKAFVFGILDRAHTGSPRYAVGRLLIQQFLQLQVSHPEELRHSYAGVLDCT